VPLTASPPPSRSLAGLPVRPPRRRAPARAPPRLPRSLPRCQHLLEHGHRFFWTLSAFSISSSTHSGYRKLLFHPISTAPSTIAHRTSAVPLDHRRPAPTLPLDPNTTLLEHHRDSLQLIDPPNSIFLHQSVVSHSTGELRSAARSASPSAALTATPHPQSRAQTASLSFTDTPQPIQTRS
jgi:hypothetical protein